MSPRGVNFTSALGGQFYIGGDIYQQIGAIGLSIVLASALCAFIGWKIHRRRHDQRAFDTLALYVFRNHLPQEEVHQIFDAVARSSFGGYSVIADLKVLRESIDLCLTSKNRQTAEGRMDTVEERFGQLRANCRHRISPHVLEEVASTVDETRERFKTFLFVNVAQGHIDKAEKLKTPKAKLKHLAHAREVLEEGLSQNEASDELRQGLANVRQMSEAIGGGPGTA